MKIVITGASGNVGRHVVRYFLAKGAHLLLVGRDPAKLLELFPEVECCSYDELVAHGRGYHGLLHLAVLNNNVRASPEDFLQANVELTKDVVQACQSAGIRRFTYTSSVHALDARNQAPYAVSKRIAGDTVAAVSEIGSHILYLSAVIGDQLAGRLAVLDRLPRLMRVALFELYAAVIPVVPISSVAEACWKSLTENDFPSQMIVTRDQNKNLVFLSLKRTIDVIAALTILVIFSWFLVIIWLAVRLQSPGPGIFAQKRVGKNGKLFTCYKFRTMGKDSPNLGTHEVSRSFVTPLGSFLRRTKIDELPQAVNILLNQMSLVGPRPCLPNQKEVIAEREELGVLDIKPGITGLAQINQIDMSKPKALAGWDARYVKLRSLRLDFNILLQTALGRGNGDAIIIKE